MICFPLWLFLQLVTSISISHLSLLLAVICVDAIKEMLITFLGFQYTAGTFYLHYRRMNLKIKNIFGKYIRLIFYIFFVDKIWKFMYKFVYNIGTDEQAKRFDIICIF